MIVIVTYINLLRLRQNEIQDSTAINKRILSIYI
jgi:hypothetical protein